MKSVFSLSEFFFTPMFYKKDNKFSAPNSRSIFNHVLSGIYMGFILFSVALFLVATIVTTIELNEKNANLIFTYDSLEFVLILCIASYYFFFFAFLRKVTDFDFQQLLSKITFVACALPLLGPYVALAMGMLFLTIFAAPMLAYLFVYIFIQPLFRAITLQDAYFNYYRHEFRGTREYHALTENLNLYPQNNEEIKKLFRVVL
jgi:hypothetical protein